VVIAWDRYGERIEVKLKMARKFLEVAAWVTLAVIVFATLGPVGMRPVIAEHGANFERFGAYALASALLAVAYPERLVRVGLAVTAIAAILECLQLVVPNRDAHVVDAMVKIAGGLAGVGAGFIWHRWQMVRRMSVGKS
jgi:VanZ family protein